MVKITLNLTSSTQKIWKNFSLALKEKKSNIVPNCELYDLDSHVSCI